jgi:hypothetical protein
MIDVNKFFPHDPRMSEEERARTPFPDALRGYADRQLAQYAFDGWLASNPETARKFASNPQERTQ